MQRKINDGENPKILATQSTQNKTETNSSKKQTPKTGMYPDTLKGHEVPAIYKLPAMKRI
jgi:hypothetical protein